jgi:HK97 family phage major capsid protein
MRAGLPGADQWAPKAIEVKLPPAPGRERFDLTKGTATKGAELIPTSFSAELMRHLIFFAQVRQTRSRVLRTSGGENLLVPKTTAYGSAAIVAEAGAIGESDQTFGQITLSSFKYANLVQLSRELVEDEAIDITGELARVAGLQVGTANGAHLVTGTGSGQPQGVANTPVTGFTFANYAAFTGNASNISTDGLIDLFHSVNPGYRTNGEWLMRDQSLAAVRKFKDTTGQFIWQPGLTEGAPDRLLGRPVITDPTMPISGAGAAIILFGDFNLFYTIRDVDGVRFERSDDFAFANDLITYRVILRTDAKQVLNDTSNSAVKAAIITA